MKKKINFIVLLLITISLIYLLNNPTNNTPPLGKFLNPYSGFWLNGKTDQIRVLDKIDLKNLDDEVIVQFGGKVKLLVSLEENTIHGGFGSGVLETLSENEICVPTLQIGVPDRFISQGSPDEQLSAAELSPEQIFYRILERLPVLGEKMNKNRKVQQKILAL